MYLIAAKCKRCFFFNEFNIFLKEALEGFSLVSFGAIRKIVSARSANYIQDLQHKYQAEPLQTHHLIRVLLYPAIRKLYRNY